MSGQQPERLASRAYTAGRDGIDVAWITLTLLTEAMLATGLDDAVIHARRVLGTLLELGWTPPGATRRHPHVSGRKSRCGSPC